MMTWVAHGAPHHVALPHCKMVSGTILSCRVTSPASHTCEWLVARRCTVEPHCRGLTARFAGYDDATYLHILLAHDGSGIRCLGNMRTCL
jgi:hypothetical protein